MALDGEYRFPKIVSLNFKEIIRAFKKRRKKRTLLAYNLKFLRRKLSIFKCIVLDFH